MTCSGPGLTRRRRGKRWEYLDPNGMPITDEAVIARADALVLPPAWRDVWICQLPMGHIQATGIDARGRRQYRYHDQWRMQQDASKFDRALDFAERLPAARVTVSGHLAEPGLTRDRVLGCAFRLLEMGFFRIGSEEYAETNKTYGLATMRRDHVSVSRQGVISFDYVAKSGKRRQQELADADVLAVVGALKRRRGGGDELLAYRTRTGWADIRSADVNAYLRQVTGGDYTAKDFRTWNATVLAAVGLAVSTYAAATPTARTRAVTRVVKEVADKLGNTPAVCRASYIDPRVIDRYQNGETIIEVVEDLGDGMSFGQLATHGPIELAVLGLLRDPAALRRAAS
ncbi:MAG: DNA topoisomerase IB [Actinomycetota bacterium]|nr:DNA topoisomerase IB [Actinomycetota bacterium]